MLYLAFVYYLNIDLIYLFLISLLLLSIYSEVYLWRQSASRRSTSIIQELQGMSSKFQLCKLFLMLNVCVVFKSDNDKLVHFFRLPSCKCDICCLEKVTFKLMEATNTETRQEHDPCRVIKTWAKWLGGTFSLLSLLSWALEKGSGVLSQLLISAKLPKLEATWLILFELL